MGKLTDDRHECRRWRIGSDESRGRPGRLHVARGQHGSHVSAPVLTPNIKYDPSKDFVAIGPTADAPAVIVARKGFPAKDLNEFVAYLKANGDKVKQAHGGIGSSSHMACLLFATATGVKPTLVAYRGTGPAMNDLVGGHVDFFCEQAVSVAEQVRSGTIVAYAVSSPARLASLPDVPTAKELGVNYEMNIWAGIFAPKGAPPEVVTKLSSTLDKSLDDPAWSCSPTRRTPGQGPAPVAFDAFVKLKSHAGPPF